MPLTSQLPASFFLLLLKTSRFQLWDLDLDLDLEGEKLEGEREREREETNLFIFAGSSGQLVLVSLTGHLISIRILTDQPANYTLLVLNYILAVASPPVVLLVAVVVERELRHFFSPSLCKFFVSNESFSTWNNNNN